MSSCDTEEFNCMIRNENGSLSERSESTASSNASEGRHIESRSTTASSESDSDFSAKKHMMKMEAIVAMIKSKRKRTLMIAHQWPRWNSLLLVL